MIYLMSTTVIPAGAHGVWTVYPTSVDNIQNHLDHAQWLSAVGHESTAQVMSTCLDREVEANRITVCPQPGDVFYCFKLDSRPPEGAILDLQTLESLGFSWVSMTYHGNLMN